MNDQFVGFSGYIHGSSPAEQHRLSLLNDILNESWLDELDLLAGDNVLDLGSGLGQFTRLMARTVGSSGRVLGIERDRNQIERANELAETSSEQDLVEFRQGDVLELPLDSSEWGSFDVAHARFLLEHTPRPALVLEQMVRSLRPGGRVFVADDDHDNLRLWPEPAGFAALWQAYVRSYDRLGNDPYVGRRLVALLRDAGLTSISNTCVFFGGCAGNERFEAVADNLIGVLVGAANELLSTDLIDETSLESAFVGLHQWRKHPSATSWYSMYCANGLVPDASSRQCAPNS